MPKHSKPSHKKLAADCDKWNIEHGPSVNVRYWPGTRDGLSKLGVTTTAAIVLGGHTAGVYISGSGFVALTHVEPVGEAMPGPRMESNR